MITAYKKKRINKKSLRLQILTLLKIRFSILNEYKSVIKESMVFLCSPSKQLLSSKLIFKTADFMWISINDKSTDYNFYTKRAILGTIYSVVILFWLNDKSNKLDKTYNLLEKLIMNMNFISSLKKCLKTSKNQQNVHKTSKFSRLRRNYLIKVIQNPLFWS